MWSFSGCLAIIQFEINNAMDADIHLDKMRAICIMTSSIRARDRLLNGDSVYSCVIDNVQCCVMLTIMLQLCNT